jgi:hypothetical protein
LPKPATPYQIEALGKTHDHTEFDCGSAALNRYLHQQARQDAEKSVAAPFVHDATSSHECWATTRYQRHS